MAEPQVDAVLSLDQAPVRHRTRGATLAMAMGNEAAPDTLGAGRLSLLVGDFAKALNCELAFVCNLNNNGQAEVGARWGVEGALRITVPRRLGKRWGRGRPDPVGERGCFVGRALGHGRPAFEALDPVRDANLLNATDVALTHALTVPVDGFGHAGRKEVLVAGFATPPSDLGRTFWIAASYAQLIALLDHHPDALTELVEHSHRDALTGCLTYDRVVAELIREINRSARATLPLSCCFIDLDGFKRVNDRRGHLAGNEVLADVGRVLREGVRSCDTVGRYGGDEFVVILPQTQEGEAAELAERLRLVIAAGRHGPGEPVTASIGVAQWRPGNSSEELLAHADRALFDAKANARGVATYAAASPAVRST